MLTRPRRRVAATMAVVLLSIAPTAYVATRAHQVRTPTHLRVVEAELARRLGVLARVEGAAHPRPDVDVLTGVSLRLDDSGRTEIARAEAIRITREGEEITLKVDRLRLGGEDAEDVLDRVLTAVRRLASGEAPRINLVADSCVLAMGERSETLHDLAAIYRGGQDGPSVSASYVLAEGRGEARTRCEMALNRKAPGRPAGAAATTLEFRTLDGAIPARVLDAFFPTADWLGPRARLDGRMTLSRRDGGAWEATFRGDLADVDLSRVVGLRFAGHRMTGLARLAIESAEWAERPGGQGPGWVSARGTLTSGPGSISVGLLQSLGSRMRFRLPPLAAEPGSTDVDFQALGLGFAMDARGELVLTGGLGGEFAPDAVLVREHRGSPLARAPLGAASVRGLWNALIPAPPESLAPAVSEAHALRALPLPPAAAARVISAN